MPNSVWALAVADQAAVKTTASSSKSIFDATPADADTKQICTNNLERTLWRMGENDRWAEWLLGLIIVTLLALSQKLNFKVSYKATLMWLKSNTF